MINADDAIGKAKTLIKKYIECYSLNVETFHLTEDKKVWIIEFSFSDSPSLSFSKTYRKVNIDAESGELISITR